ncbi:MAG: hypothetical protein VYD08_08265 [Pseudomonadota bacterium]|nr:hypothetical protein [Pseudomonadota bacterium]
MSKLQVQKFKFQDLVSKSILNETEEIEIELEMKSTEIIELEVVSGRTIKIEIIIIEKWLVESGTVHITTMNY